MVDPIIVSYSELDTFRQCPLKHHLSYGMRWTKPPKADSALAKGSLWHMVAEVHYRALKEAQDAINGKQIPISQEKALLAHIRDDLVMPMLWDGQRGTWSGVNSELIAWMYDGHVAAYGIDRDWRIMGIEHQIITPLRDRRGRPSRWHLKAKIDLLVRDRTNGGLWVVDHKSGANLPTQMDLEIDDQFGLYSWSMREMGRKVIGSIHSANRTTRNQGDYPDYVGKSQPQSLVQRLSRTYLSRSEQELSNLALDAYEAARAAHPPASVPRARYSSPDPRSCGWKCDFKEIHLLARKGRNIDEALVEYGFRIDRTRH